MSEKRVMLVDDEETYLLTAAKIFRRSGLAVEICSDALSVVDRLRETPCQVVVLDLKMPGANGLEVLRDIRRWFPGVQVIMLTGHATADDATQCLARGAMDFLVKPVEMKQLLERVQDAFQLWNVSQRR